MPTTLGIVYPYIWVLERRGRHGSKRARMVHADNVLEPLCYTVMTSWRTMRTLLIDQPAAAKILRETFDKSVYSPIYSQFIYLSKLEDKNGGIKKLSRIST